MIVSVPLFRVFPVENVFEIKSFLNELEKRNELCTIEQFTFISVDKATNKNYEVTRVKVTYMSNNNKVLGV